MYFAWDRPAEPERRSLVTDATLWTSVFAGMDSPERFRRNGAVQLHPLSKGSFP